MKSKSGKQLGVGDLIPFAIGNCVGAGIFVYMGLGVKYTGRSLPLALVLANVVMLFAYAYNTLMAGTFALSGGKYAQGAVLQPPVIAGVYAIMNLIKSLAIAGYAISVVNYASYVFPGITPYTKLIAIGIQTLFFALTFKGTKLMSKVNIIMVGILMVALCIFIAVGLPQVDFSSLSLTRPDSFSGGVMGFLSAIAVMGFACEGSTIIVSYASETKKPTRTIPIAILISTAIIAVIYFLMSLVAVGVLPIEEIAGQSLAVVAKEIFSYPVFAIFIICGACFAIATSLFGLIASLKYPILSTVEDGWLPEVVGSKTKDGYPWVIMLVMYIVAVVPIITDMSLNQIASYLQIPFMILCILNNVLFLQIPKKYPEAWKKSFFHMPMPCLYIVIGLSLLCDALVAFALFSTIEAGDQIIIVVMVLVIFAYSYFRYKSGKVTMKSLEEACRQALDEIQETSQEG